MLFKSFMKNLICLAAFGLAACCALTGCASQPDYKEQADQQVYNIIDNKWPDDLGSKTNYIISDVESEQKAGDIRATLPPSGVLTLPQAIAIATTNNRQYQTEKEILYATALDLTLVRHQFEPNIFGGGTAGYNKEDKTEGIGAGANWGFRQLLTSGTRISTDIAIGWAKILTGDVRSGLTTVLSAAVTKPLLRGSQRKIVLENLTQAERNTLYQIRTFNRFRKELVVSVMTQYYRVLQQYDRTQNAQNNYQRLTEVYKQLEILAGVGRRELHELEQAKQDQLIAMDTSIKEEKLYRQALDEFKLLLSIPTTTEIALDAGELTALTAKGLAEPTFTRTLAIETAKTQRLDLMNNFEAIADAERKVEVAADSLRAELNLVAGGELTSSQRSDFTTLKSLEDSALVGLELDLPLDRLAERNIYRKAQITLAQRQREYDQAVDLVTLQIRQSYRDLTEAARLHKLRLEQLQLARQRFDKTSLLLQYDRASTRDVLDAQDDLLDAQNDATEALVNHTIATLNFYRDAGVMQIKPDGMWQLASKTKATPPAADIPEMALVTPDTPRKSISLTIDFDPGTARRGPGAVTPQEKPTPAPVERTVITPPKPKPLLPFRSQTEKTPQAEETPAQEQPEEAKPIDLYPGGYRRRQKSKTQRSSEYIIRQWLKER